MTKKKTLKTSFYEANKLGSYSPQAPLASKGRGEAKNKNKVERK